MSTIDNFPGTFSNWENLEPIGKGGSSTVFKAIVKSSLPTYRYVAVKQIDVELLSRSQLDAIRAEIETMKTLSSTNIVQYYGMQETQYRIFIVMEYADIGSLRQFYNKNGKLFANEVKYCLQQIVSGLNYLHNRGIAHRDVKCANCLLFSNGLVKLADFGASKRFESQSIVSGLKGTPHWMAPEVIKGTQMTDGWIKADVWSLGCTAVEMITGKVPYAEFENPMTAMYRIANGEIPKVNLASDEYSEDVADLITFVHLCCTVNAEERLTLEMLRSHPNLSGFLSPTSSSNVVVVPPRRLFETPDLVIEVTTPLYVDMFVNSNAEKPALKSLALAQVDEDDAAVVSSDSLESFPTPALYTRKRIINFANCESTDQLPTTLATEDVRRSVSTLAASPNGGNYNHKAPQSRESTAPSFAYVNIPGKPALSSIDSFNSSNRSWPTVADNQFEDAPLDVDTAGASGDIRSVNQSDGMISFNEASLVYNQFIEKYSNNNNYSSVNRNYHPVISSSFGNEDDGGETDDLRRRRLQQDNNCDEREVLLESNNIIDNSRPNLQKTSSLLYDDDPQEYEDDFLTADPGDDVDLEEALSGSIRPNAPLTGEMLQLQLQLQFENNNTNSSKEKVKQPAVASSSIAAIRNVAKKELEELEMNKINLTSQKTKSKPSKGLPKLAKLQPRVQHQPSTNKRGKTNQKNNNLNDSLKGVRSFSAGTYLHNSGNHDFNSIRSKQEAALHNDVVPSSLPPLRPMITLPDESLDGTLGARFIQSAPAVSRSVNLPPITHHLSSATPNPKKTIKSRLVKHG